MKKILCLLMIITLVAGCSSKPTNDDNTQEDKKITESSKEDDSKKDDVEENQEDKKKDSVDEIKSEITESPSNTSEQSKSSNKSDSSNKGDSSSGAVNDGGSTPPKEETPPPVPATPTEQRAKADAVMAQINAYRQQNGLNPFIVDNYLINSSSQHAYAMAEARALWHSGAAECITNYDDPFSAWKNSPSHNEMLLNNNRYGAVSIYYVDGYYYSVFHTSP